MPEEHDKLYLFLFHQIGTLVTQSADTNLSQRNRGVSRPILRVEACFCRRPSNRRRDDQAILRQGREVGPVFDHLPSRSSGPRQRRAQLDRSTGHQRSVSPSVGTKRRHAQLRRREVGRWDYLAFQTPQCRSKTNKRNTGSISCKMCSKKHMGFGPLDGPDLIVFMMHMKNHWLPQSDSTTQGTHFFSPKRHLKKSGSCEACIFS